MPTWSGAGSARRGERRKRLRQRLDSCQSICQQWPLHRAINQSQTSVAPFVSRFPAPVVRLWWSGLRTMCCPVAGPAGMIRIDEIWLATEPLDMRAGPDKALARVIQVFGSARPHCAYLFANKRGKFHWGETWRGEQLRLTEEQLSALVQGLPWQRVEVCQQRHTAPKRHLLADAIT